MVSVNVSLFPMKSLLSLLFFLNSLFVNFSFIHIMVLVSGQCQSYQQSLLLQVKNNLTFNSSLSVHLVQWNQITDCCDWSGVDCDVAGHVVSLNLSNESISAGIETASTSLFGLEYLQNLNLAFNWFNETQIPSSLANLTNLSYLNLSNAGFAGQIPDMISVMTRLVTLDCSFNHFSGPIPSFNMSKNLSYLDLSHNFLTGSIASTGWEQLLSLVHVDFTKNSLEGNIPPSLFALPSLQKLHLADNRLQGQVPEFSNASSSVLDTLDLSGNILEGPIPKAIFKLKKLQTLLLSSNNFNGTIQLGKFQMFDNLTKLDLSYNSLDVNASNNVSYFFSKISTFRLASCKLRIIPNLKNQSQLLHFDLSDNEISGKIPNWIWELGNGGLTHLNLSHNLLVGIEEPYSTHALNVLDLRSNHLLGRIPSPPPTAVYVDFSSNNFNSSIPADIGNFLLSAIFFSLSNNSLTGVIPESICNATKLQLLDLSSNNLSGLVPACLIERSETLAVLNLGRNNLNGTISGTFPENCGLQTLDLRGNQLEGMLPKSLINCSKLEVLDLANNHFYDTFPCWLKSLHSSLRVIVLRSNNLYGSIQCQRTNYTWPILQIVDLACNNFSGRFPHEFLQSWLKMTDVNDSRSNPKQLQYAFRGLSQFYYQYAVTVTSKGQNMELVKIQTIFTSIDISCNNIEGPIPEDMGLLRSLHVLNMSHNALTGTIPSSIGNLEQLESVDLSMNKLSGEIPAEIANLNFLEFLNLSYNQLVGRIPVSTQLQSFSASSFEGNEGLFGPPLTKEGINSSNLTHDSAPDTSTEINWDSIVIAVGFGVGYGAIVAPLMFSKNVNTWYNDRINKFFIVI